MTDEILLRETRRSLPIALLRAREAIMQHFRPMLAAHNLTEQQWRVMRILAERGIEDASELANQAFILPPSLSRILDTLEQRGLIERLRDIRDRRRARLSLSVSGHALIRAVSPDSRMVYAMIEDRYGEDRVAALLHLLDELAEIGAKT